MISPILSPQNHRVFLAPVSFLSSAESVMCDAIPLLCDFFDSTHSNHLTFFRVGLVVEDVFDFKTIPGISTRNPWCDQYHSLTAKLSTSAGGRLDVLHGKRIACRNLMNWRISTCMHTRTPVRSAKNLCNSVHIHSGSRVMHQPNIHQSATQTGSKFERMH